MKKIIILLLISSSISAQKQFSIPIGLSKIDLVWDTLVKNVVPSTVTTPFGSFTKKSIQNTAGTTTFAEVYQGKLYYFLDTLVAGDVTQYGTSGLFKLTVHTNLISTTKRSIFIDNILWQFDTATNSITFGNGSFGSFFPITIRNTSTGKLVVIFNDDLSVERYANPLTTVSLSTNISKITY